MALPFFFGEDDAMRGLLMKIAEIFVRAGLKRPDENRGLRVAGDDFLAV